MFLYFLFSKDVYIDLPAIIIQKLIHQHFHNDFQMLILFLFYYTYAKIALLTLFLHLLCNVYRSIA